jgi:hypothetical protein
MNSSFQFVADIDMTFARPPRSMPVPTDVSAPQPSLAGMLTRQNSASVAERPASHQGFSSRVRRRFMIRGGNLGPQALWDDAFRADEAEDKRSADRLPDATAGPQEPGFVPCHGTALRDEFRASGNRLQTGS